MMGPAGSARCRGVDDFLYEKPLEVTATTRWQGRGVLEIELGTPCAIADRGKARIARQAANARVRQKFFIALLDEGAGH